MSKADRKAIRIAVKNNIPVPKIAKNLGFSYQAVYAYVAGRRKSSGRLIPERSTILTEDHMKWAEKASRLGLTASKIAEKLGVSEATFWRTRKDYRAVLAEKVKRAMLVSNAKSVSELLGVRTKDIPGMVERAAENPLEKRLEKRLEGWEL